MASTRLFVCSRACLSDSGSLKFFVTKRSLDNHRAEEHGIPFPASLGGISASRTNVKLPSIQDKRRSEDDATKDTETVTETATRFAKVCPVRIEVETNELKEAIREVVREEMAGLRQEVKALEAALSRALQQLGKAASLSVRKRPGPGCSSSAAPHKRQQCQ